MNEITLVDVKRAVAGEKAAMEQIMRALERPFYNLALRMLLSPTEGEFERAREEVRACYQRIGFDMAGALNRWGVEMVRADYEAPARLQ